MGDYRTVEAGSINPRGFTLVAKASGSPIVSGTVNWYLKAITGANAGKWWRDSDQTWQASETANAMTHQADGHWTRTLAASPFVDGDVVLEYAKESGDLHVPAARLLKAEYTPAASSARRAHTDVYGNAGAGLTALGDARLAYLDVAVSSRAASVGGGSGANTVTVTVTGGGSPLEGASVRLTKAGISYVLVTDASGVAVFSLDAGTYALAVSLAGWAFTPSSVVVDGAEAVSATMTQVVIPAPTEPDTCVCWLYARDQTGAAVADVDVQFRIDRVTGAGAAFDGDALTVTSAADGLVQAQLPVGAQVAVQWYSGQWRRFTVPDDTDYELPSIIV